MADFDFIALIEGKADLKQAKQDFLSFKQQAEQPIKITFDTSGLNVVWSGLQKQAKQAGVNIGQQITQAIQNNISNIKIPPNVFNRVFNGTTFKGAIDGGSLMNYLGADIKLVRSLSSELAKVNAEGGQLQKITFSNNGDSFDAVIKNANTLVRVMGELNDNAWTTTSKTITTDYTNAIKQAQKEAETLATKLKEVDTAFTGGKVESNVAKIRSDLANIGAGVDPADTKRASDAALEYLKIVREIQDSLNGTTQNPLQGQDLANRYRDAQVAFDTYNNAMATLKANAKSFGIETGNAMKQAQAETNKLAQEVNKVQTAFNNGEFTREASRMNAEIANIGSGVNTADINKVVSSATEYYKIVTQITASLNGKSANPLQGQDLVDAYANAQNALEKYNNAFAEMQANAKASGVETGNAIKQAQTEADKLAKKVEDIGKVFSTGTFDRNTKMMEKGLTGISSSVGSDLVKKASDAAAEYYKITQEIEASINKTSENPLQGEQLVKAFEDSKLALKSYLNAMDEVRASTDKMLTEGAGERNANQVETWAKNNSRALKQYGAQLDAIAQKMRNAKTEGELKGYINEFKNLKAEITAVGQSGISFGDQIKRAFVHIGEFTGIYAITSKMRQLPREMVQEVIKVDTAMTELRKVSTASASEISDYFDSATESAFKYGQAINEVIDSTASWTRLGYDLEDASTLTDVTAKLAKVGSGLDTKSATEGLQATIRGFGLMADEAERVGDMINYVADTQPIDALGIINGLERSSAAMREMGNSLEETIGLITATTSVTQDASSAGTAWRTVALRIAGAKNELEEAGLETDGMVESTAKLRDEILAVAGVDILDATGKGFKSTYQIMEELSKVWGQLSDLEKSGLLDKIAGKRGSVAVSAVLQNFDVARSAMVAAGDESAGSMDKQLKIWESSIQASLDRFKVAFQKLSVDMINSDFIKGVVDVGTHILQIIDALVNKIGVLGTVITGLGLAKVVNTISTGVKSVDSLAVALGGLPKTATGIQQVSTAIANLGLKAGGAGTALSGLGGSIAGLLTNPVALGVGVLGTTIAGIVYAVKKQREELSKQAKQATSEWSDSKSGIETYKQKYAELNEQLSDANLTESQRISIKQQLIDLQTEINNKYGDQSGKIDLVNGKLETQLGLLSNISEEEARRNIRDNRKAYDLSVSEIEKKRNYNIGYGKTQYLSQSGLQSQLIDIFKNANFERTTMGFKFTGDTREFDKATDQVLTELDKLKDEATLSSDRDILDGFTNSVEKAFNKNSDILTEHLDNYKSYLEQSLYADGFGDELSGYIKRVKEYNDALLGGDMDTVLAKRGEMLDYYKNNIENILSNNDQYKEFFENVTAQIDVASQKLFDWQDIVDDGTASANNSFEKSADYIKATVDKLKAMGYDGVDIQDILLNGRAGFNDLFNLGKLWDESFDPKDDDMRATFADFLAQLGVTATDASKGIDLASVSFEDFMKMASNSIETVDKVNSALIKSFASGGMSFSIDQKTGELKGDIAEVMKAYQGLDSYDASKVFERTAKGVIVNRDALRELQKEQEKQLKDEFANRMTEAWNEWNEAVSRHDDSDADYWKTQYENVSLLASAYDGATSAYQKWLDAQKMGEAGDMYDTVAKTALDRGKELYDKGLVGTNEFRAIAQLYSDVDLSTASVDELTEAYENGYSTVKKYFTEGQEGAVAFADKIVELGYATKDAEDNYDFFNGIDTEAIAHDLGISVDLVESAFNKLGDYGFKIHFDFDSGQSALMQFEQRVRQLTQDPNVVNLDVAIQNDEQLREIAEYLLTLDDDEITPIIDLEGADTVDEVIEKLRQKYSVQATVTADTSSLDKTMSVNMDAAFDINQQDLKLADQTVHVEPEPNPLETEVVAKLNSTEVDNYIKKVVEPVDKDVIFHKKSTEVDNYNPPNHERSVNYDVNVYGTSALDALPKDGSRRDVYIDVHTNQLYTGTVSKSNFQSMGRSHARGTAHASGLLGKVGLKSNETALINELGPEIIVRPSEDSWMIFNGGKPTFASLKKDDVVFNAEQTQKLLANGSIDDYARLLGDSYANGTITGKAHATKVRGGGKFKKSASSSGGNGGSGGGGGGGNGGGGGGSTKDAKEFSEILDEIEIKIDRIERAINNLDTVASNTFNSMYTRQSALASEISKTTEELDIQKRGYKRYIQEANKYASGLSADIIRRIQNGEIDIQEFKDEDTWKKIESYKKWYDLAMSCRDSVYELQQAEADLWKQRFDVAQTNYENKIAQIQHMYDSMDSYIDLAENNGRITTNKYRQKQITEENKKIKELQKEYDGLKAKMKEAIESGSLTVGSEGYYEMLNQLNSVQEEIISTRANVAELNKSIMETNWDIFDKGVEKISNVSDELEFLYQLLGEKLYDDKGTVTDNGIAGFGILASQYNLAMIEARKYADEINKINGQIEADQYNQDLLDRRDELYESQRKMIEQANKYKESIRDLVKDGIEKQIDSLKELVKNYEDLIDTQKDEMDYAKRIADQQENVNRLQKQLNAYANDDTEEGATRRQRLRNELKTAQENLQKTQEERRISQTKKMLSDLQDEYEKLLNARLDDLDALVQAVVDGVNKNGSIISSAIKSASDNVGYAMTHEMETMLSGGKDLVSYFTGGKFVNEITKAVAVANNIDKKIDEAVTKTNESQTKDIKDTVNKQNETLNDLNKSAKTGIKNKNAQNKVTGLDGRWITDSKTKKRVSWAYNDGTKATGWSQIDKQWYYFNDEGKVRQGLQTIGKNKYYLRAYGGRANSEWVQVGNKWYYFDKYGRALSGWHNLDKGGKKSWFYFDPKTNAMMTNSWIKNSSKKGTFYVDEQGRMLANGKFKTKDGFRTFDKNGKWKGYKLGTKSVGADGLYWTNEGAPETIIRKSDGAILTKLNTGDSVLNNRATSNIWDFANNPQKFLRSLGVANTGNDVDLVINLNGLKNPSEFMEALRKDKKFEKFIQEVTIGRVVGHGSLAKNAMAF